jgi:hypothetical protein
MTNARVLHLHMKIVDCYSKVYLYTYVNVVNTRGFWFQRKGAPPGMRVLFGFAFTYENR